MKTYSIFGPPPPPPKSHPATLCIRGHYGVNRYRIENDKQYHGLVFWLWGCHAAGHSINSPLQRDVDGGDLQVKGQT